MRVGLLTSSSSGGFHRKEKASLSRLGLSSGTRHAVPQPPPPWEARGGRADVTVGGTLCPALGQHHAAPAGEGQGESRR